MKESTIKLLFSLLLLLFVLPLLFAQNFNYPGWAINYRMLSYLLVGTWFGCYLFGRAHYFKFANSLENFCIRSPSLSFALISSFILIVYLYSTIDSFRSFGVNAIDFSYFDELIPSTLKGEWMYSRSFGGNHFGVHSTWIMLFFTPFYLLTKSPYLLVCAHAIIVWSTIFPLRKMLGILKIRKSLEYFFILGFFFSSYMAHNLNYNFHVENFMIPLFMWIFYFVIQRKFSYGFWGSVLLALLVKEDVAFYLSGLAVFLLLKERRVGGVLLFACIATAIINLKIVIPLNRDTQTYVIAGTAGAYGSSISEILKFTLHHPVVVLVEIFKTGWKKILVSYLFIPAFTLEFWIFLAPAMFIHSMATSPFMKHLGLYYSAPFISAIFACFVIALLSRHALYRKRELLILLSSTLLLLMGNGKISLERFHPYYSEFASFAGTVQGENICVQASFYPHFSQDNDKHLLSAECLLEDRDLFVMSNTTRSYPFSAKEISYFMDEFKQRPEYQHTQIGDIHIFKRVSP